jgi:hypothetical protein
MAGKKDLMLYRPGLSCKAEKKWSKALSLGIAYLASSACNAGISLKMFPLYILFKNILTFSTSRRKVLRNS